MAGFSQEKENQIPTAVGGPLANEQVLGDAPSPLRTATRTRGCSPTLVPLLLLTFLEARSGQSLKSLSAERSWPQLEAIAPSACPAFASSHPPPRCAHLCCWQACSFTGTNLIKCIPINIAPLL